MNIADTLFKVARDFAWANPHIDSQATFRAVRLSREFGAVNSLNLPVGKYTMPVANKPFAVFSVTSSDPSKFRLGGRIYGWRTLAEYLNEDFAKSTFVSIFSGGRFGVHDKCYIGQTKDGVVLLAVDLTEPVNSSIFRNNVEDVYVRFYTNALVNEAPIFPHDERYMVYRHAGVAGDYTWFENEVEGLETTIGRDSWTFLNGCFMPYDLPRYNDLNVGDVVEVITHHFIEFMDTQQLKLTDSFVSVVDDANKIIFSKSTASDNVFVDDFEIFVAGYHGGLDRWVGLYFPKLYHNDVRQLTFKDWSIKASKLANLSDRLQALFPGIVSPSYIFFSGRKTKTRRLGIQDQNRTRDLENLNRELRIQALSGINSTLPLWKAKNLETAPLNTWMNLDSGDVLPANLPGVFSRQSAIEALEAPWYDTSDSTWRTMRSGDLTASDIIEFDEYGFRPNVGAPSQSVLPLQRDTPQPNWRGYELRLPGVQSVNVDLDIVQSSGITTPIIVGIDEDVWCYYDDGDGDAVNGEIDVDFTITDGDGIRTIQWLAPQAARVRYVRSSLRRIHWRATVLAGDIKNGLDIYEGVSTRDHLLVGMANLYVWADNRLLIEGLDYSVKGGFIYPSFSIVNASVDFEVLYCGLPNKSLTHEPKNVWGWSKHGKISYNSHYDLLAYRNNWLSIAGAVISPRLHDYSSEDYQEIGLDPDGNTPPTGAYYLPTLIDGLPYQVVPRPSFIRRDILDELVETEEEAAVTEHEVSVYANSIYDEPIETDDLTIASKYDLVSELMDALIEAIDINALDIINPDPSDTFIWATIASFTHILDRDVTQKGHDLGMVSIHPKFTQDIVDVSVAEFNFLTKVNEVVLNNQVGGLNLYLNII